MSPKIFSAKDGVLPKDLVRYGLDHISGGFKLFGHPFHFDSAGYLVHIGYECLLKGWILELTGKFDGVHSIKELTKQIPELSIDSLPPDFIEALAIIDEYRHLRYPNRNIPQSVGSEEMELIRELVCYTISLLPNSLHTTDAEAHVTKGGRTLMKKKIDS